MITILMERLPAHCSTQAIARNELALRRTKFLVSNPCSGLNLKVYESFNLDKELELVGPRKLPTIYSLMEHAFKHVKTEGLIGILNSDIILSLKGAIALAETDADIVLLSRNDVTQATLNQAVKYNGSLRLGILGKPVNSGISCDGWFLSKTAWETLKPHYPKAMLIGEPWWDTCAIHLSKAFSKTFKVETLADSHALHPIHRGAWEDLSKEALQARNAWFNLKGQLRTKEIGDQNV